MDAEQIKSVLLFTEREEINNLADCVDSKVIFAITPVRFSTVITPYRYNKFNIYNFIELCRMCRLYS